MKENHFLAFHHPPPKPGSAKLESGFFCILNVKTASILSDRKTANN
jgi:hypothetical protein